MINALYTYDDQGNAESKLEITLTDKGILHNRHCHPWRQVLIVPVVSLDNFKIRATQLRANIVINAPFDIHALKSGSTLHIGKTEIRLTFHCEPCKKIKGFVSLSKILHQRGYLGQVIQGGTININDSIHFKEKQFDPIPYSIADRIKWYLQQQEKPVLASKLVEDIGLSKSYCRAIPSMLKNRPDINQNKIIFLSNKVKPEATLKDDAQMTLDFD